MSNLARTHRSIVAGTCLALAVPLLGAISAAPAGASRTPELPRDVVSFNAAQASGAGEHNVTVRGPAQMKLRSGCRETYSLKASFDVAAGEDYWVNLRGQDSQGHTIDGSTVSGTATEAGRKTIKRPLLLCGSVNDAGVGKLQVSVHVGDEQINGTAPTVIRYVDRVRMNTPPAAVERGQRLTLRGVWDRGVGFGLACGYYNRIAVKVLIDFKPVGGSWRQVAKTGINGYGAWQRKVKVNKTGRFRARIAKSDRYRPARSVAYLVQAR